MTDLPPLRDVIARHGLSASKALGQNFLFDEQLLDRIAALPGDLQDKAVLEIGPGPGGLTRALLRAGARVTAIEMDRRCLPALAELEAAFPGQLTIVEGDAMKIDHGELMGEPFAVVANLPYNVGTALFVRWLGGENWPPQWTSLTLMFQQEVAQRIVSRPGSLCLWPASHSNPVAQRREPCDEGPPQRLHPAAQGDERHRPCHP